MATGTAANRAGATEHPAMQCPHCAPDDQITPDTPKELIVERALALARVLSRLVDAFARRDLGLTCREWRVLVALNRLGTSPSGEVARMSNFDRSQVSRVAFELSKKGLVTQVSDPADRRKQNLAVTPAAAQRLRDGVPVSLEREARLKSRLSALEYASFVRALDALEDEARAMLGEMSEAA